jgi:hypothetical protein
MKWRINQCDDKVRKIYARLPVGPSIGQSLSMKWKGG